MIVVHAEDVAPRRWKNGGGSVRELLSRPAGDGWRVRIAVADIDADGPFSDYPGVVRHFVLLQGDGVELQVRAPAAAAAALHRLTLGSEPLVFDGGAATHCRRLGGSAQALNLMLRGGHGGGVWPVRDGEDWAPPAAASRPAAGGGAGGAGRGLYTAVAGRCGGVDLPAAALLWFDADDGAAPPRLRFVAGARPVGATGWWLAAAPPQEERR